MKLKVLQLKQQGQVILRNDFPYNQIIDGRIIEEKDFDNRYFTYSILLKASGDEYGVRNGKLEHTEISDEFKEKIKDMNSLVQILKSLNLELFKLRYAIVDTVLGTVFYDGDMNDMKTMLYRLFDINSSEILHVVDIDEMKSLSKLRIKVYQEGQLGFQDDLDFFKKDLSFLNNIGDLEYTAYEFKMIKSGAMIQTDQFKKLMAEAQSNLVTITASGFDNKGNEISINSNISKRIEILPKITSWEEKRELELKTILDAVKEEYIDD